MALSYNQFMTMCALSEAPGATQRELSETTRLGLATVNTTLKECVAAGFIDNKRLTAKGLTELKPYEVDNAVIMAAGLSSRFASISHDRPKGLLKVRGEVLIERQIKQLKAAGINDIVVVVGYKQESFFYLEDEFGVKIVVNRAYAERNNNSSLMLVREILGNTYICSSDNYFEENPFERHVWKAYYSAQHSKGHTDEWCMQIKSHDRITKVTKGGHDAWYMIGHAFFDRAFSKRFREILEAEYDLPETRNKLWEDLFAEHLKELDMAIRCYDPPIIHEFDSLDELRDFDPLFLENLDSEIFNNIASVLGCEKSEVRDIYSLKQGLTNLSCHFTTNKGEWVYRHPGVGTELLVNRQAEKAALETAAELGLDHTFVFEDPKHGWKISKFVANYKHLDGHDEAQLKTAMEMARKLHGCGATVNRSFSFYEEAALFEKKILEREPICASDWNTMKAQATRLNDLLVADGGQPVLCHNDFFGLNFLIGADGFIDLIDWEYAGMSDYANDFGTFSVCERLSEDEMRLALTYYFGRTPTEAEWRHNLGHVGMAGWCWYAWSVLKEIEGGGVGEWAYTYYRYAKTYLKKALALYDEASED